MDPTQRRSAVAETRTELARRAILEAARTVFLRRGYPGAGMEEIAALAAVSKQTIYNQFTDKAQLFTAVITTDIAGAERRSQEVFDELATTTDIETDLQAFARSHITAVLQPNVVQMRRVVISQADRFPELARTWSTAGPERGLASLTTLIERLCARGLLHATDPALAAEHLNWLILSVPLNRAMFYPDDTPPPGELRRLADEGVRVFLAAYRTTPSSASGGPPSP